MSIAAPALISLWRREFSGYSRDDLQADVLAGLTVVAVVLAQTQAIVIGVAASALFQFPRTSA